VAAWPERRRELEVMAWDPGRKTVPPHWVSVVAVEWEKRSVDSVHTFASGLARTAAGRGHIPHVSATLRCLQGLECSSSPTSGTAYPLVRGVFALTCRQSLWWRPLTLGARAVAWPPRWPIQVGGWRGKCRDRWALRRLRTRVLYTSFRLIWLVAVGQHLFMGRGSGHNMIVAI
jgi:hypothetical protein